MSVFVKRFKPSLAFEAKASDSLLNWVKQYLRTHLSKLLKDCNTITRQKSFVTFVVQVINKAYSQAIVRMNCNMEGLKRCEERIDQGMKRLSLQQRVEPTAHWQVPLHSSFSQSTDFLSPLKIHNANASSENNASKWSAKMSSEIGREMNQFNNHLRLHEGSLIFDKANSIKWQCINYYLRPNPYFITNGFDRFLFWSICSKMTAHLTNKKLKSNFFE